jgi:photosystem II stability/assembly factor-like uncharacterized protein
VGNSKARYLTISLLLVSLLFISSLAPITTFAWEVESSGEAEVKAIFQIISYPKPISPPEVGTGENVSAPVTIKNTDDVKRTFYASFAIQDPAGNWYTIPYETITLGPEATGTITLYWTVDSSAISGYYNAKITVWTYEPHKVETKEIPNAFEIITTRVSWERVKGPWEEEFDPYGDFSGLLEKSIAIDPRNPKTIYVGSSKGGGLYKSTDNGNTWREINEGLPHLPWPLATKYWPITAIAIAPSSPSIIYVGTSNPQPYSGSFVGGKGVYKSIDGGLTWFECNGIEVTFPKYSISSMVVDPTDPKVVYVGTISGGVWKTVDGGDSWRQVWKPIGVLCYDVNVMAISPTDSDVIYIAAYNYVPLHGIKIPTGIVFQGGLYRSVDGGNTFNEILGGKKIDDLIVNKRDANKLYAVTNTFVVYRSIDGGKSWEDISDQNVTNPLPLGSAVGLGPTLGEICSLAVEPKRNTIYVSDFWGPKPYVYFTEDLGQNWYSFDDSLHDRVDELIISPDQSILYAVTDNSLFKIKISTTED